MTKGISLLAFIALCFTVAAIGGYWTHESVSTWYPTLVKPSWTPPDWVFGPVWTVLYLMIAVAGWLIYQAEGSPERTEALIFYGVQLFLNFIWSFLFFALRSPTQGLVGILLLLLFIALTLLKARHVRPLASVLLLPYFLWVLYATSLNLGIWMLNR